jgi:hypothetical protein
MPVATEDAVREVKRLSRTGNYPTDREGVIGLAQGLQKAAKGIEHARAIVNRCLELSAFCPTDHDLLTIGQELIPPPPPPSWTPDVRTCPAKLCDGHGWAQVFHLVTEERHGEATYKRRERITREQYATLARKVDGRTQRVYEGVELCACSPRASSPEAA